MCSLNNTTLYVGVTSTLAARIVQHRENYHQNSFTSRYNCRKLIYYHWFDTIIKAMDEEKRIKGGSRKKKEMLINSMNPERKDLYEDIKFL